nr:MAG TPA: hypothetical protein [Caudoviricetes sp.]
MMFGNYNAYQPIGTPQQFAMDQMQQFQQRAQMQPGMQQGMQLIRVTGMDGAKAYQMPPNSVVPLFDADNDIMYVKSTDGAGFPTIRAFAFQPVEDKPEPVQQYVTRDEFDAAMKHLREAIDNGE